ncbi:MAG: DMT family transporter, partial [Pseudomonadota bacterium]
MSANPISPPPISASGSTIVVHFLMLAATFLVATSFPVVAAITGALDSAVLTFVRFLLATLLFAPLVALRYGLVRPGLRDLLRYSVLSILLVTFFWCMFASLRLTTPLNTAALFALNPVITAVIAAVLLRERMLLPARMALPLGSFGAIWVVFRGDSSAMMAFQIGTGDLMFLA